MISIRASLRKGQHAFTFLLLKPEDTHIFLAAILRDVSLQDLLPLFLDRIGLLEIFDSAHTLCWAALSCNTVWSRWQIASSINVETEHMKQPGTAGNHYFI